MQNIIAENLNVMLSSLPELAQAHACRPKTCCVWLKISYCHYSSADSLQKSPWPWQLQQGLRLPSESGFPMSYNPFPITAYKEKTGWYQAPPAIVSRGESSSFSCHVAKPCLNNYQAADLLTERICGWINLQWFRMGRYPEEQNKFFFVFIWAF